MSAQPRSRWNCASKDRLSSSFTSLSSEQVSLTSSMRARQSARSDLTFALIHGWPAVSGQSQANASKLGRSPLNNTLLLKRTVSSVVFTLVFRRVALRKPFLGSSIPSPSGLGVELDGIIYLWWYSLLVYGLIGTGTRFRRVRVLALLEVCIRPWSLQGSRGCAPMGADGWVCSLLHAAHQILSLLPCTVTANEAAGHNRGGGGDATSRQAQGRTVC